MVAIAPVGAEFVVGGPLFRVLQHLIGLAGILEPGFGVLFLTDIGMVFPRQFSVGLLDLVLGGIAPDPQDLIIILIFHAIIRDTGNMTNSVLQ